jgi:hypothetical protein
VADRTVRAIFEARVTGAQKGMRDLGKDVDKTGKQVDGLSKDLTALDKQKVQPSIDVKVDDAKRRLTDLKVRLAELKNLEATPEVTADITKAQAQIREVQGEIRELNGQKAEVRVDAAIDAAKKRIQELTLDLGTLRSMEVTPVVSADIKESSRKLREAKAELRDLNGAKAVMTVGADVDPAKKALSGLADDVADAGDEGGEEAGDNIVTGIIDALRTIPIAGAVIGVGVAIAGGILLGIQQGLAIEAERDIFSAQTGLDEDTSARFGRAAGEAYANAWGDSVAANLETARFALQAGIIDSDATDAEVENVIAKLQALSDLFQYDIAESVRGVGNLMRVGLVKDADQAFDLIVAASKKVSSDDLIDTITEYSNQFVLLGLSAEQAFGLIAQGSKAGARDTDITADALKEMGLRIREGTQPAIDALKMLGLNAKDIVEAFQKGGPDAVAGMDKVFDALRDLEEKGGNTQAVIAALFGGPGEDLGAALYALDVQKAAEALSNVDGAAGDADAALKTMSDNTATRMEEAKRNVELAMDGIKGALAEAFGDDISGAAEWVKRNRAPMLEFFLDAVNGTIDIAEGFATMGATALDVIGDIATGFADLIDALPQWLVGGEDASDGLRRFGTAAHEAADEIRDTVPPALDEIRDKANTWAAPEILKARIHDATVAMTGDLKGFVEKVGEQDLELTINGDTVNAEEALAVLVDNINAEDGTVLINGDPVPAEDALETLLGYIAEGEEDVSVGADTAPALADLDTIEGIVSAAEASMTVNANTAGAQKEIDNLARDRYMTITATVRTRVAPGYGDAGRHEGGWINKGLHAGGRVPGHDPGYDNVLWPLNSGGRTLAQPLAGGEYVVNSKDSAYWAPVLEWMNGGGRPTQHTETHEMPVYIENLHTNDAGSFRREMPETVAWRKGLKAAQ